MMIAIYLNLLDSKTTFKKSIKIKIKIVIYIRKNYQMRMLPISRHTRKKKNRKKAKRPRRHPKPAHMKYIII